MSAIPTSDMLGYESLKNRVFSALDRCQESQAIEFKESSSWNSIKWKIIKTLMAMGNLRDGGVIIIGVSERNGEWDLSGIKQEHLNKYDTDNIVDEVNKYASPSLSFEIVRVTYSNNKDFLVFQIKEFENTPYICKKNGPDSIESKNRLKKGKVYIRPLGKPQTKSVENAQEMQDLLELSAEKRARKIIETAHRIGMVPDNSTEQQFDNELEGL